MCGIGHHQGDTIRPPRRHSDGSVTAAVRRLPRKSLKAIKDNKTAELRAAIEAGEAEDLARQHGAISQQLELIPRDQQELHLNAHEYEGAKPKHYWQDWVR